VLLVILTDLIHSIKTTPKKKPGQVNNVAGFSISNLLSALAPYIEGNR
jgi:hypothetical protein